MRIDEFGRRVLGVPATQVPAELICCDDSDAGFWTELAELVGSPVKENLGIVSAYDHRRVLPEAAPSSPWETEVFAHEYFLMSLGSSRHLGRGRFLWKGTGRNQLAVHADWLHSWGGMTFTEGMNEFVLSQLLGPECAVPVKALLRYTRPEHGEYVLLRDQWYHRLSTVPFRHDLPSGAEALRNHLHSWIGDADPWEKFLSTFTAAYRRGFVHRSPTGANFDVVGRLIDLNGSYYFPGRNVEVAWVDEKGAVENPLSPLTWLIEELYVPLYGRLYKRDHGELRRKAEVFLSQHFHLHGKTPSELLNHIHSVPASQKKFFGNWVIIPAKGDGPYELPTHSVTRKLELLSETVPATADAASIRKAIALILESSPATGIDP